MAIGGPTALRQPLFTKCLEEKKFSGVRLSRLLGAAVRLFWDVMLAIEAVSRRSTSMEFSEVRLQEPCSFGRSDASQ
jgi:hypothetical protein